MKKAFIFLIGVLLLTGCSYRHIPQDVVAMREPKQRHEVPSHSEVIIVDAGHGGKDSGAASKRFDYEEKALTLKTAQSISRYLNRLGYKTVLTRTQDVYVPLSTRAEMANTLHADLFVSIHYNFSPNEEAKGIEVYSYRENKTPPTARIAASKILGTDVLRSIVKETKAASRGMKEANFAVIRETTMPAILIEAGFLSNSIERKQLQDPAYLDQIALGIAQGVDQYLTKHRK